MKVTYRLMERRRSQVGRQLKKRRGLVLLLALGMLALFTLLAVTYVVAAGSSRAGSVADRVRANTSNSKTYNATDQVLRQLVGGTNDIKSAAYKHGLIEDVYGRAAIQGRFGHIRITTPTLEPFRRSWCSRLYSRVGNQSSLVKVSLDPRAPYEGIEPNPNGAILSPYENAYNSRLITIMEGPLHGKTFRILKYVGYVRSSVTDLPDPNLPFDHPSLPSNTATTYVDANGRDVDYSILIDLGDIQDQMVTFSYKNPATLRDEVISRTVWELLGTPEGVVSLFFRPDVAQVGTPLDFVGYKFVINDAPFNSPGIGLEDADNEDDTTPPYHVNSFGNLDGSRLLRIPTNRPRISPNLLPNYDYTSDPNVMATEVGTMAEPGSMRIGVPGVGDNSYRAGAYEFRMRGASTEGYDVADFRDFWLASRSYTPTGLAAPNNMRLVINPSFHRPELIYYISNLFGDPDSMLPSDVLEMLRLIDASSARVMSYTFGGVSKNPQFSPWAGSPTLPPTFTWSTPPTTAQKTILQQFVASHIQGPWDFDNDGDGQPDSILADFNLPTIQAPNGQLYKPLAAVMTRDLDSRINVNVHGDRIQGVLGYDALLSNFGYPRATTVVPQGFGYGPADISLTGIFGANPLLLRSTPTSFSMFDQRYGAFRFKRAPINLADYSNLSLDRVPGYRETPTKSGNDWPSQFNARESQFKFSHMYGWNNDVTYNSHINVNQYNTLADPGMGAPSGRRSAAAATFDRIGNLAFHHPAGPDADPYFPSDIRNADEALDDPYEISAMNIGSADDPFTLADLESLLRRYDESSIQLPSRLRERIVQLVGSNFMADEVNQLLTTRSGELRYPVLAATMAKLNPNDKRVVLHTNNPNSTENYYAGINTLSPYGTAYDTLMPAGDTNLMGMIGLIKMLHEQRYRSRSIPANPTLPATVMNPLPNTSTDDPELNVAAISELFSPDFAKGLRMEINRPFGNGHDDSSPTNYMSDEPKELIPGVVSEKEQSPFQPGLAHTPGTWINPTTSEYTGTYLNGVRTYGSTSRLANGSRQILARHLYCLAQLLVPRDYTFPTMKAITDKTSFAWYQVRAKTIAQWAINVVDFRDADSVSTRFEYDIFPFGIRTMPTGSPSMGTPSGIEPAKRPFWAPEYFSLTTPSGIPVRTFVGVVWGMEAPELLLTESLQFHDMRLRDTDIDDNTGTLTSNPTTPDSDLDQYRFPQGSMFLELMVPRTLGDPRDKRMAGISSAMHSVVSGGTTQMTKLNVSKLAPASPTWGAQPVWRVGISNSANPAPATHPNVQYQQNGTGIWSRSMDVSSNTSLTGNNGSANPEQNVGSGLFDDWLTVPSVPATNLQFDRMIWFSSQNPVTPPLIPDLAGAATDRNHRVYYNRGADISLSGGSYLVIGPRAETPVGSAKNNPTSGAAWPDQLAKSTLNVLANRPIRSPSYQKISLTAAKGIETFLLNGELANRYWDTTWKNALLPSAGNEMTPSQFLICAADTPTAAWNTAFPNGIGLNISMPNPISTSAYWSATKIPTRQLNSNDNQPGGKGYADLPPDSWVDLANAAPVGTFPDKSFDILDNPVLTGMTQLGTYQNVRAAYLQRLADPESPYDPITNPYLTVDWISLDLTVFNGETSLNTDPNDQAVDDPMTGAISRSGTPVPLSFQSRYKDGANQSSAAGKATPPVFSATPQPPITPKSTEAYGYSYLSASTAKLLYTPVQPLISSSTTTSYPSYFPVQLGYATRMPTNIEPVDPSRLNNSATTLGYLNIGYRRGTVLGTAADQFNAEAFDGFGLPNKYGTVDFEFVGVGKDMTSIPWLNRSFASPYEIMMVPFTSSGQLGTYFATADTTKPYDAFTYLPSFFSSNPRRVDHNISGSSGMARHQRAGWGQVAPPPPGGAVMSDLELLLEFVETEPQFADSIRRLAPDQVYGDETDVPSNGAPSNANDNDRGYTFNFMPSNDPDSLSTFISGTPLSWMNSVSTFASVHQRFLNSEVGPNSGLTRGPSLLAPFNKLPSYVAPGKVNLNTMTISNTGQVPALKALEFNYLNLAQRGGNDSLNDSFVNSRRGYDVNAPAGRSNFFQSTPYATGILPQFSHLHASYPTMFAGAFRPALSSIFAPAVANTGVTAQMRSRYGTESTLLRSVLYSTNAAVPRTSASPLYSPDSVLGFGGTTAEETSDANRNAFTRYQRAMRLPNLTTNQSNVFAVWVTVALFEYDPATGFGREYLDSNGERKRERAFFIIDRTVPVGFLPGEDLNTSNTILLKRKLNRE